MTDQEFNARVLEKLKDKAMLDGGPGYPQGSIVEAERDVYKADNERLKDLIKKTMCPYCESCLGCGTPLDSWHSEGCPLSPTG